MPHDHRIAPGDHVVRLAYQAGHATVDAVWNHPANAELRDQRPDPGVLVAGDLVHVPDAPDRVVEGLLTRRDHRIVLTLPMPQLRLVLERPGGIPHAAMACVAEFDDTRVQVVTDARGGLELELHPHTSKVQLDFDLQRIELTIATLEPVDTIAGWHARLDNLGYQPGSLRANTPSDPYALRSAVEEFQCDHGLKVDGMMGPNTKAALLEAHGA